MRNIVTGMCIALLAFSAGFIVSQQLSTRELPTEKQKVQDSDKLDVADTHSVNSDINSEIANTVRKSDELNSPVSHPLSDIAEQIKILTYDGPQSLTFSNLAQLYSLAAELSEFALLELMKEYFNTESEQDNTAFMLLFGRYAELNPKEALDFVTNEVIDDTIGMFAQSSALYHLAKQDPIAAFNYFEQNSKAINSRGGRPFLGVPANIFSELATKNMSLAIDKLQRLNDQGYDLFTAIGGITQTIDSKQEFIDLLAMTKSIESFEVESEIISNWTAQNPEQVANWLTTEYHGDRHAELKNKVFQRWFRTDKIESANWMLANASPDRLHKDVNSIVSRWGIDNPESALKWFSQQPIEIYNQTTFASFLKTTAHMHPRFTAANIHHVQNERERSHIASSVYSSLKNKNVSEAQAFLDQSPFKDEILKFEAALR